MDTPYKRRRFALGVRTSSGTTGTAALEIIAAPQASGTISAGPFVNLMEISFRMAAATASTFGIGIPAVAGITPTTPAFLLSENGQPVLSSSTSVALAWATGPTLPLAFHRRVNLPGTVGVDEYRTTFQNGLFIPRGTSLVLWNLASNGVIDVNIVVEEGV